MNKDIDDDACVRLLVDVIFNKQVLNAEEMKVWNPSVPIWLFTEDFIRSFQDVLRIRRSVILHRWQTFFDTCYQKMLSSHEMYLTYVMFACVSEDERNHNVFESFVSVCAVVKFLSDETLKKTGLNFCNLIPDIITIFYQHMKGAVNRCGGIPRLAEFIRHHRYLTWKLNRDYSVSSDDSTDFVIAIEKEKLKKELKRERVIAIETDPDEIEGDELSMLMAEDVLRFTGVELPTLPINPDLLKSVIGYTEKKMVKNDEEKGTVTAEKLQDMKVALQGCSSLKSRSKTNCIVKHQDNIEQYENIIQAVIRHNHSKSSSNESPNIQIQEKAEGVLEHLKDEIKSLIEVLDEYDNE